MSWWMLSYCDLQKTSEAFLLRQQYKYWQGTPAELSHITVKQYSALKYVSAMRNKVQWTLLNLWFFFLNYFQVADQLYDTDR